MFEAENDFGFVPGFEEFPFDGGVPSSLDQLVDWLDIEGGEARDGTSAPHDIQHFREAGDSAELTSNLTAVQPALTKATGHDFSVENFDPDLDLLGDLHGFGDPLGDASMDSFTDLTALLGGNTFLDEDGATTITNFLGEPELESKGSKKSLKRTLEEVEVTPEISFIPTTVVDKSPSHDHDYVAKRPRMSTLIEEASVEEAEEEEESVFLPPAFTPLPSTSQTTSAPLKDKYRNRREKNNIASKRSRDTRKRKFADMEAEADRLQTENARLETRIVELERLAKQMKEILVAKMAGKA
ncbi:hypothetical protein BaRGS_00037078 [Batillaria attramentaria]|uniref:BZIP domain-containing protein n=1 Tax=Batillaria attramentaria TaxID=370345 RepID=A0ABD0J9R3_9CAEN